MESLKSVKTTQRYPGISSKDVLVCLIFLGAIVGTADGFKQQLLLHLQGGNALYFDTHVPDLSDYKLLLPKVRKICTTGIWSIYKAVNYEEHYRSWGSPISHDEICFSNINATRIKSLRYLGASDASLDSISLYSGRQGSGNEILVTGGGVLAGINSTVESIAVTGKSKWMLYEGKQLNGAHFCISAPHQDGFHFKEHNVQSLGLPKIGSVFKGCDLLQIGFYRQQNFRQNRFHNI